MGGASAPTEVCSVRRLGRHGIERFFFFVRGRLLRPLVPLVAASAERVQRSRPQCDAPNPCPVPRRYGGKNPRVGEKPGGIPSSAIRPHPVRHLSATCPPFVRCLSALRPPPSAPCPPSVRRLSPVRLLIGKADLASGACDAAAKLVSCRRFCW